jgi:hypothetical protein
VYYIRLFSVRLFSVRLFSVRLFSVRLFSVRLFSVNPALRRTLAPHFVQRGDQLGTATSAPRSHIRPRSNSISVKGTVPSVDAVPEPIGRTAGITFKLYICRRAPVPERRLFPPLVRFRCPTSQTLYLRVSSVSRLAELLESFAPDCGSSRRHTSFSRPRPRLTVLTCQRTKYIAKPLIQRG